MSTSQKSTLDLSDYDQTALTQLRAALKQNPSYGVGTNPNSEQDKRIHSSMLRLEARGLVKRAVTE